MSNYRKELRELFVKYAESEVAEWALQEDQIGENLQVFTLRQALNRAEVIISQAVTAERKRIREGLPKPYEPTEDEFLDYNHGFNKAIDAVKLIIGDE